MAVSRGPLSPLLDAQNNPSSRFQYNVPIQVPSAGPVVAQPMGAPPAVTRMVTVPQQSTGGDSGPIDFSFLSGSKSDGGSKAASTPSAGSVKLDDALASAMRALSAPDSRISGYEAKGYAERFANIAAGNVEPPMTGVGGTLKYATDKLLGLLPDQAEKDLRQGASDAFSTVVNFPLRTVESWAKEVSDLFREDQKTSFIEFVKQTVDKDFNPEYVPVQSLGDFFGKDWTDNDAVGIIDSGLTLVTKIAADPSTWVTFSPMKFAGSGGRAALADELMTNSKAFAALDDPSKAQVLSTVQRYGDLSLPTEFRQQLVSEGILDNVGVRYMGRPIVGTGGIATDLGGGFGTLRARIGDVAEGRIATALTPASRQGLVKTARGVKQTDDEIISSFATWSAARRAKADAARIGNTLGTRYKDLINRLSGVNTLRNAAGDRGYVVAAGDQRLLLDYAEGAIDDIRMVPPDLQVIAAEMRNAYDEALREYNDVRMRISQAYGLRLEEIPRLDDFVHRTLTAEARAARSSKKKIAGLRRAARDLGVAPDELFNNSGFTMSRKIKGTFLGETLVNNTIGEINDIAMRELGYKLFEDNAGRALGAYLQGLQKQLEREFFIDHLFRLNPKAIKPLLGTTPTANELKKIIDGMESTLRGLSADLTGRGADTFVGRTVAELKATIKDMRTVAQPAFSQTTRARAAVRKFAKRIDDLSRDLVALRAKAERAGAAALQQYDLVAGPIERRLAALRAGLEGEQAARTAATEWLLDRHTKLFPDVVTRPTSAEALAADILRDAEQRLGGAARAGVERKVSEAVAAAPTPRKGRPRTVTVEGTEMPRAAAQAEVDAANKQLRQAKNDLVNRLNSDPTLKAVQSTEGKLNRALASMDAASALAGTREQWEQTVGELWRADIDAVRGLLDEIPKGSAGYEVTAAWLEKVRLTLDNLQGLDVPQGQREALDRVFTQLFGEEGHLATMEALGGGIVNARQVEANVRAGLTNFGWVEDMKAGWKAIRNLQVQVSPELADSINMVYDDMLEFADQLLTDPKKRSQFIRLYDIATRYWKGTALLTAGYSVRNALTATFNNIVFNVTPSQLVEGIRFSKNVWAKNLEQALAAVPASRRKIIQDAYDAVQMSGGNAVLDEIVPVVGRSQFNRYNSRMKNLGYAAGDYVFRPFQGRLSAGARQFNENVELAMRMGLAIRSIEDGLSPVAAAARIARVQFDYTDLSPFDLFAKNIVPFWVFASRNIPLQMVNQAVRPGVYSAYDKIAGAGDASDSDLVYWRARKNPLKLPFGEWFLDLDLPQQAVMEDLKGLTSLQGIGAQANPFVRGLAEYTFGGRLGESGYYPFSDEYKSAGITDIPAALLASLVGGGVERDVEGNVVMQEKFGDFVSGMLPALQNIQRYGAAAVSAGGGGPETTGGQILGGPERYYGRDPLSTLFGAVGIGAFRPTDQETESEMRRRAYLIREELDKLRKLGYLGD